MNGHQPKDGPRPGAPKGNPPNRGSGSVKPRFAREVEIAAQPREITINVNLNIGVGGNSGMTQPK